MSKNKIQGQALVEWTIFGLATLILWACSLQLASKLLIHTALNGWSMVAARLALSNMPTEKIDGIKIKKHTELSQGSAKVFIRGRSAVFTLEVPQISGGGILKKDLWSSPSPSFGSHLLPFLQ